jgi:pyruvate dehydrogenase E2 component (dihydrolipoamide acetyltransferase)
MTTEIRIPKIGMSAAEMMLSEWMFEDGEQVQVGDVIYTIETDKTTTEVEAQVAGVLRVLAPEGEA